MGKLFTAMRNAPKRTSALFAMIAAATIVPAALLAWGPDRPTFTVENPADYVTFNSITNNPHVGDERNFVVIKDAANTGAGGWQDEVNVEPGKEYLVRMYVHNNANANLNKVATNTRVKAHVPATTGKSVQIDGFVSADNAQPQEVWDQAVLKSGNGQDFNVAYVAGSTKLYNNKFGQAGATLSDSIVTNAGAPVGYEALDGRVPGCFEYAGYVTFKVKPQFAPTPDFTMSKQVRKPGTTTWGESLNVKPGDDVEYLISYKNTGEVKQDDVVVKDTLPKGISYVNGTTKLKNGLNPDGKTVSDNVTKDGVNISNYNPGAAAYVWFTAKVGSKTELECGTQKLVNTAKVETGYGDKEDTADVIVDNGECEEPPKDIKVCELSTKKIITIDEQDFDSSKHSKNYADCKENEPTCPIPGKEHLPVDSPECKETPVTPPVTPPTTPSELPSTGPVETALSVIGLGSLIASIGYYISSRRALLGR